MKNFLQFVKLTRPLNLFIIALTMWLMRYYVLRPMVEVNGLQLQLSHFNFFLLILSTVLIAAAGNVINDYFDQKTDRVNKPKDIIVGVHVKRRVAMVVHQIFNLLGLALAVFVAWRIGMWKLSILSFFAAGSLWFYSVQFKKDLIIGNVIIAFLAGLVPLIVGIYEVPLLIKAYGKEVVEAYAISRPTEDPSDYFRYMFYFIFGYSVFAFILNLIREIQKDMADIKGDIRIKARTIPIVYGLKKTKIITAILIVGTMISLVFLQQKVVSDKYSFIYLIVAILIPLAISLWYNHRAVKRPQFVKAGNFLKLAMLGGVLYSIVHYYIYYAADLV
ncbi:UbiA family prenyltransferase [Cryomorpha ignava]|uniref:UbiA family prenyltransferase n=1 Tax=Cryomorpha ignava TaxID=101383 RepID=A0A7K3WSB8_9FLAO|nr:geranylgeranylglycerol-phosphate geranylgeranyltransferase [Cryomorpha ignava]NEN23961.1 UbiA family prenyltransferase [Cryomorpha ignava]